MEVFSVDSDVVNPVESEVFDFIASCRVLLTVTFAEKISVPVEVPVEEEPQAQEAGENEDEE